MGAYAPPSWWCPRSHPGGVRGSRVACCGVVVVSVAEVVAGVVVRLGEVVGLGERLVVLRLEAALVGDWACGVAWVLEVSGSPIGVVVELGERTRQRLEGVGLVGLADGRGVVVLASAQGSAPRRRGRRSFGSAVPELPAAPAT
jgi:hypothetical protein